MIRVVNVESLVHIRRKWCATSVECLHAFDDGVILLSAI